MEIRSENANKAVVLQFVGDADVFSVGQVREALGEALASSGNHVVCDLTKMEFVCSDALGCLISARHDAERAGGFLKLVGPQRRIAEILDTTQLNQLFAVYPTIKEALGG
ncbi:MAG: STAS domain-containing protein [Planctomycetes bacterium]|nr:STAS domain-containing protein [Planctomycetota bacterium]